MQEIEFYNDLQKEYKPKTNSFFQQEILKNMTDSEIAEITTNIQILMA